MSAALKIKAKSYASETRHIKAAIRRRGLSLSRIHRGVSKGKIAADTGNLYTTEQQLAQQALYIHLKHEVTPEARATHLARMFLSDVKIVDVEQFCYSPPDWAAIERMILKYGSYDVRLIQQRFAEWKSHHRVIERPKHAKRGYSAFTLALREQRDTTRTLYHDIVAALNESKLSEAEFIAWWQYRYETGPFSTLTRKQVFAKGKGNELLEEARKIASAA